MTHATANASLEKRTGTLVVVVGPSGVGKDSLMDIARRHFSGRDDVRFVRRTITRPQTPAAKTMTLQAPKLSIGLCAPEHLP